MVFSYNAGGSLEADMSYLQEQRQAALGGTRHYLAARFLYIAQEFPQCRCQAAFDAHPDERNLDRREGRLLDLNDKAWSELEHAHGAASDIPEKLRQLAAFPPRDTLEKDPYFSVWSALLRQNRAYSASYAALPHMVAMMEAAPERAHWSTLELVTRIEIARATANGPALQGRLAAPYESALSRLPWVIAAMSQQAWDEHFTRTSAAALAAARQHATLAEAILELRPGRLPDFLDAVADE